MQIYRLFKKYVITEATKYLSMQANQHNIVSMRDKIEAMKMKLRTWIRRIESNVFEMFANYSQMITNNGEFHKEYTNYLIQCHFQK